MPSRALIVDANILVRAVLGKRVRAVIEAHAESASFFLPEVSYPRLKNIWRFLLPAAVVIPRRRSRSCAPCEV